MIRIYYKILFLLVLSQIVLAQQDDTCTLKFTYRGVEVFTYPQDKMLPASWMKSPVSGKVSALKKNNEERSVKLIKKALDKYPVPVLEANVKKVYMLGHLEFYGMTYGGTYYEDIVYMDIKDAYKGYTAEYVEKTFHHEFSSVLFHRYKTFLDSIEWIKGNETDFKYGSGGVDALFEGKSSLTWNESYHNKGFLNQYSMSAIEEDFNEICGNLVTSTQEFWNVVDTYPLIKQKVMTAIKFYSSIDKAFTEEYFRSLTN